jgi:hypothetical protein
MTRPVNIDQLLRDWPYEPGGVLARVAQGDDGRDVVQMRIEMGLLQMEVTGRPDGQRPEGFPTYYDYLLAQRQREGETFVLGDRECAEIDREFVQFYHRRICWLAQRNYRRAAEDADHTLALMDFSSAHAPDEQWAIAHEQYRPFVLFHRTQAVALAALDGDQPDRALDEVTEGLRLLRTVFVKYDAADRFEDHELIRRLIELKTQLREHYRIGPSLAEQLADAVASEQYELAARLRDEIRRRDQKGASG